MSDSSPAPIPPDPERTDLLTGLGSGHRTGHASTDFALAPAADAPDPAAPETVGRYRVTGEIARGGMGSVLAARDPDLDREVAIKVLLPAHQGNPAFRRRFAAEARITGRLQHPGVVPVYEVGELPDGRPFFIMGLVCGQTLDALLAARKGSGDDLAHFLHVFERVCQAVAHAHAHGVIHRDLKPLNVMVAPFGVVKVMDWGLAKSGVGGPGPGAGEDDDAQAGWVMGTPAYMAPEQAQGDAPVDRRADVFGLGGILCTLLTGRPPHPGIRARDAHARAARGDPADAFARLDASPAARELALLAKACLATSPADRPRDAGEVATALTAYIESDLRRAERDLVRFFELSPDLFCIAGVDGYFRRVNPNFTRVLGYTPEELISRPFADFVHPDDRAGTAAETEKVARGLPCVNFRNRYRDVAGNYRWFEWTAKAVPEEGVIFAVARDITDRVALEARLGTGPMAGPRGDAGFPWVA